MAIEGHNRANRSGPEPMSRAELNEIIAREGATSGSILGKPGTVLASGRQAHGRNR